MRGGDALDGVGSNQQARLLATNIRKHLAAESEQIAVALTCCMGAVFARVPPSK
jgi:hypothetical protein